ncbi:tRNA lysidine(34) synthetase TilS [Teredinibacter haidensis]|uniref:tRNA lysidine(34) synthetase TilS n=1 Tax=Teredinibacter haidensis TaxID=2731755 RepID=UPI000949048E|nr:tRNA lysidine(34) synthetase TilS [Teredinibacter haidensis]
MASVFQALEHLKAQLGSARHLWVGYSGGLDSTVLLQQLVQLGFKNLTALHVHHQLSGHADSWAEHCRKQAEQWACDFKSVRVSVDLQGRGLEQAARDARYRVFNTLAQAGDIVLTAHHAGDQAETFLFRLLRGAGLKGLAGVPKQRPLDARDKNSALLLRPFLTMHRSAILSYAQDKQLRWIEDDSNSNTDLDRNYLRHKLVPVMEQRWPNAVARIEASADLLQQSGRLLDEYLAEDLNVCDLRPERLGCSLSLDKFTGFSWLRQKHLLRYWLVQNHYLLPGQQQLEQIQYLISAADDANPEVSWGGSSTAGSPGCSFYRFQLRLYLLPRMQKAGKNTFSWNGESICGLGGGFVLGGEKAAFGLAAGDYEIRFRSGGERCRPEGRDKSQTLKKLLQEYRLEPWLRDRVPLIYHENMLVAVGDLWLCKGGGEPGGYQPRWYYQPQSHV